MGSSAGSENLSSPFQFSTSPNLETPPSPSSPTLNPSPTPNPLPSLEISPTPSEPVQAGGSCQAGSSRQAAGNRQTTDNRQAAGNRQAARKRQAAGNRQAPASVLQPDTSGRLTSKVWHHFEKVIVNGVEKAKCLYCYKMLSAKSKNGTSHLKDHILLRCRMKHLKIGGDTDIRQKLLSVNRMPNGSGRVENHNFSQEISRKELCNMVVMHEYSLGIVDHIGFRRFVGSLNPSFKIISRNTLRSDILKRFAHEKNSLKKCLEDNTSRIAITTDMWTASNQKRGYMAVTAHFIDEYWVLRNRTLRFAYVPCPHTKDTLAQVLMETLNAYNIAEKVSSVVVDNCTTNDAMMSVLKPKFDEQYMMMKGEFLHMRCSAHILNLIVQDGLDVIGEGIEKIRDCVAFWTATPKRDETFENKVKALKIDVSRKLFLDCKTRWNSTFLMIQSALPYKTVFSSLKIQNPKMKFVVPSSIDWHLAESICEKLKMFHKVTEIFSGRNFPTSNLFFRQICEIKLALTSWLSDDELVIREMASKMIEKFDKYWLSINGLLAIATILDPRNKLECVEFYFEEIYGDMADLEIQRVKSLLYDLMYEYQDVGSSHEASTLVNPQVGTNGKHKTSPIDVDGNNGDKWTQIKRTKKRKVNVRSELDHFLEEDVLPESENFDILKYWNIELKYPTLQKIARDILAIPASTVASESAFSLGGRVVSPHRSRLHANTIEALMCLQNWLIGEFQNYATENARGCASILEDDDAIGDLSGSGSEVVDVQSDEDGDDE